MASLKTLICNLQMNLLISSASALLSVVLLWAFHGLSKFNFEKKDLGKGNIKGFKNIVNINYFIWFSLLLRK